MLDLLSSDFINIAVAGLGTVIAGYATTYIAYKSQKQKRALDEKQLEMVKSFEEKSELRKLEIIRDLKSDLPEDTSLNDILYAISAGAIDIPVKLSSSEDNELVVFEELMSSYHNQALNQSSIQFWFSIMASVGGFVLIAYMLLSVENVSEIEYVTRALPGVMIELVAGLFFKQATDTRKRATDYFDKLRADKQVAKGIIIANSIEDKLLKSIAKTQIALNLSGIETEKLDLLNLIKSKNQ